LGNFFSSVSESGFSISHLVLFFPKSFLKFLDIAFLFSCRWSHLQPPVAILVFKSRTPNRVPNPNDATFFPSAAAEFFNLRRRASLLLQETHIFKDGAFFRVKRTPTK